MLTKSGAKLMDFGLAREIAGDGPKGSGPSMAALTKSQPLTAEGTIVGTFQYMAPEQLEGREADARSDLWALGCVLYEMATGQRAFEGKSQASLISAIMSSEPTPIENIAPLSPPALDRLVRACLAKNPEDRIQTAHDVKLQLGWIAGDSSQISAVRKKSVAARRLRSARVAWGIAGLTLVGAAVEFWMPRPQADQQVMRFTVTPPENVTLSNLTASWAISPDGKLLAYVAGDSSGNSRIWVRPLDSLSPQMLEGSDNAAVPFWAPDSRNIGFFADGKLKKIAAAGGAAEAICDAGDGRGGTWSKDGVILFAPIAAGPVMRVSAEGGEPVEIARPDSTKHETALRFPEFLPDGRHYLYVGLPPKRGMFVVYLGELGSKERKLLLTAGSRPVYAPPGFLVFVRGGRLVAQRFDAGTRKLAGNPIPVGAAPQLAGYAGMPAVSVSRNGILTRSNSGTQNTQLVWFDRSGRQTGVVPLPPGPFGSLAVSPDGQRAVVERLSDANAMDLWMVDLARGLGSRFTFLPAAHIFNEVWSPDGNRVAFNSDLNGPYDIYVKPANGQGDEVLFYHSSSPFKNLSQWSPDGHYLLFDQPDPVTGWDSWMLPVEGDRKPVPLLRSRVNETTAQISPDGHWLAFNSDESGRGEV